MTNRCRQGRSKMALYVCALVCLVPITSTGEDLDADGAGTVSVASDLDVDTTLPSDSRAVEIAEQVIDACGGRNALDTTRYLAFRWSMRRAEQTRNTRTHYIDLETGAHRVEGSLRTGEQFVLLHTLDVSDLRVWVSGIEVELAAGDLWFRRARAIREQDVFTLIMPFVLLDDDVMLTDHGQESDDGRVVDVIGVHFRAGSLHRESDHYRLYVDHETARIDGWERRREHDPEAEPDLARWENWVDVGPLQLSTRRVMVRQAGLDFFFEDLKLPVEIPAAAFQSPHPVRLPDPDND